MVPEDDIKRFELTEIGIYILESIKTTQLGDKSRSVPRNQSLLPIHSTFIIYDRGRYALYFSIFI